MVNKPDITIGDIHAYIDRLEAENKALKEQHAHMVDASRYSKTSVSFVEAARIIGIKLNTLAICRAGNNKTDGMHAPCRESRQADLFAGHFGD